ncbi:MAG: hypothetical protein ACR2P6_11315 [Gammaproteobacteria bacterium]
MRTVLLLIVIFVAACTASGSVEQAMDTLMGNDIRLVIDELGEANEEVEYAGVHIYMWSEVVTGTMVSGSTDHSAASMGARPYRQQTCQLIVQAGPDARIIAYTWNGRSGTCRSMTGKLVKKYGQVSADEGGTRC